MLPGRFELLSAVFSQQVLIRENSAIRDFYAGKSRRKDHFGIAILTYGEEAFHSFVVVHEDVLVTTGNHIQAVKARGDVKEEGGRADQSHIKGFRIVVGNAEAHRIDGIEVIVNEAFTTLVVNLVVPFFLTSNTPVNNWPSQVS